MLTPSQKSALDALVLAFTGEPLPPAAPAVPWYRDTSSPVPTVPLSAEAVSEAEVKRYAAHGFRTNLRRGVAPSDFPTYLAIADRLAAVPDTAPSSAADAILPGAGYFAKDVAILLVLGGAVQGLGPFQTASLMAPWGAGFDLLGAASWLAALPGDAGVSGR